MVYLNTGQRAVVVAARCQRGARAWDTVVLCPNCQTDNPEAARVCRACAQPLDGPTVNLPAQANSPYALRSRRLTRLIVLGTAFLVIVFCVVLAISAIPRG